MASLCRISHAFHHTAEPVLGEPLRLAAEQLVFVPGFVFTAAGGVLFDRMGAAAERGSNMRNYFCNFMTCKRIFPGEDALS
jgi:hypothetical protein